MSEAAPQAAEDTTTVQRLATVSRAHEALRAKWDAHYLVGFDDERGWWATCLGQVGSLLTADEPGKLDAEIADDRAMRQPER